MKKENRERKNERTRKKSIQIEPGCHCHGKTIDDGDYYWLLHDWFREDTKNPHTPVKNKTADTK